MLEQLLSKISPTDLPKVMSLYNELSPLTAAEVTADHVAKVLKIFKIGGDQAHDFMDQTMEMLKHATPGQKALEWFEQHVKDGTVTRMINPDAGRRLVRCQHCGQPQTLEPEDLVPSDEGKATYRCVHCFQPNTIQLDA